MLRVFLGYALSGFVALGYQVVWFRVFADLFGSTTLTFALVVCNFIGGLGVGSLLSRRLTALTSRVTGITDGLRLYGFVELLIAATALLTVLAVKLPAGVWGHFPYYLSDGIWVQTPWYRFGQIAVALLCLFLPCLFMGVTYPLLCSTFLGPSGGPRFPSALYGWNTLGACCGVLACQFLLLPWFGHSVAYGVLIGLNAGLGVYFLVAGSVSAAGAAAPVPAHRTPGHSGKALPLAETRLSPALLVTAAILSGLMAGALEGDMFKRISLVVANNPGALGPAISFWAILGIFLASTVVWHEQRLRLIHIKIAFVLACGYYYAAWRLMYPGVLSLELSAGSSLYANAIGLANSFPQSTVQIFLFVGACVFVPYFLLSLLLPYVCNQVQNGRGHLGLAYGLNTVAFCIGLVGFTLLAPLVNIFYSLKLMYLLLACGVGFLLLLSEGRGVRWWQPAAAVAVFAAGCVFTPSTFDPSYLAPGSDQAHFRVSSVKSDGANTTYVVHVPSGSRLYFGNTSMSGTGTLAQTYMRLMAHFPLLVQEHPTRALLICFGVGNTASAIAAHSSIRQLDIVDLNRRVFETAPEFEATNFGVYRDPRVRLIHDDGRSFLRQSRDTYDLITSEPPPPMAAGVYRLYSREYYADVLAHLSPGGLMTQWLPIYQMPAAAVDKAVATFTGAFPYTVLYVGFGPELILMGGREPPDLRRLSARFPVTGPVRDDLQRIGINSAVDLVLRIMRTPAALARDYASADQISDEHNDLEHLYLTPAQAAVIAYDPREVMTYLAEAAPGLADMAAPILSHLGRLRFHVELFPVYGTVKSPAIALSGADWSQLTVLYRQAGQRQEVGDRAGFQQALTEALRLAPEQPRLLMFLGSDLVSEGRVREAIPRLELLQQLEPQEPLGHYLLGQAYQRDGQLRQALVQYDRAAVLVPDWPVLMNLQAWLRAVTPDAAVRDPGLAVKQAERAAVLTRYADPNILDTLAAAYAAAGQFDAAVSTSREAVRRAGELGNDVLSAEATRRQQLYVRHQPFVEPAH